MRIYAKDEFICAEGEEVLITIRLGTAPVSFEYSYNYLTDESVIELKFVFNESRSIRLRVNFLSPESSYVLSISGSEGGSYEYLLEPPDSTLLKTVFLNFRSEPSNEPVIPMEASPEETANEEIDPPSPDAYGDSTIPPPEDW